MQAKEELLEHLGESYGYVQGASADLVFYRLVEKN